MGPAASKLPQTLLSSSFQRWGGCAPQASSQHSSTPMCSLLEGMAEAPDGLCHLVSVTEFVGGISGVILLLLASLMQELRSFHVFWDVFLDLMEESPLFKGRGDLEHHRERFPCSYMV